MTMQHLLRKNGPVNWRCLAYNRFAVFKLSFVHHLFWIHLKAAGNELMSESEYWERWENDILKANTETFQPEAAAAATDADITDDIRSSKRSGMSFQYERLPHRESNPLNTNATAPRQYRQLRFFSQQDGLPQDNRGERKSEEERGRNWDRFRMCLPLWQKRHCK